MPEEVRRNRINGPLAHSRLLERGKILPQPEPKCCIIDRSTSAPQSQSLDSTNEMVRAERAYALRRRPIAASRTAPENSIRCIESR
jgi:hypothetical protein